MNAAIFLVISMSLAGIVTEDPRNRPLPNDQGINKFGERLFDDRVRTQEEYEEEDKKYKRDTDLHNIIRNSNWDVYGRPYRTKAQYYKEFNKDLAEYLAFKENELKEIDERNDRDHNIIYGQKGGILLWAYWTFLGGLAFLIGSSPIYWNQRETQMQWDMRDFFSKHK
jgi:hypothetical protein